MAAFRREGQGQGCQAHTRLSLRWPWSLGGSGSPWWFPWYTTQTGTRQAVGQCRSLRQPKRPHRTWESRAGERSLGAPVRAPLPKLCGGCACSPGVGTHHPLRRPRRWAWTWPSYGFDNSSSTGTPTHLPRLPVLQPLRNTSVAPSRRWACCRSMLPSSDCPMPASFKRRALGSSLPRARTARPCLPESLDACARVRKMVRQSVPIVPPGAAASSVQCPVSGVRCPVSQIGLPGWLQQATIRLHQSLDCAMCRSLPPPGSHAPLDHQRPCPTLLHPARWSLPTCSRLFLAKIAAPRRAETPHTARYHGEGGMAFLLSLTLPSTYTGLCKLVIPTQRQHFSVRLQPRSDSRHPS